MLLLQNHRAPPGQSERNPQADSERECTCLGTGGRTTAYLPDAARRSGHSRDHEGEGYDEGVVQPIEESRLEAGPVPECMRRPMPLAHPVPEQDARANDDWHACLHERMLPGPDAAEPPRSRETITARRPRTRPAWPS